MSITPPSPSGSFARRFGALLLDAGWRVAFHVGPYALTAGVAAELAARLRAPFLWKLPVFAVVAGLLLIGVLLGAHVAAGRRAATAGRPPAPLRSHLAAAPRIMREAMVLLALLTVIALAVIGTIDLALLLVEPTSGQDWPWTALRLVATGAGVGVSFILLAAGMALAASNTDRTGRLDDAVRRLHARSSPAFGVISLMIVTGTATTVLGFHLVHRFGIWPPMLADAVSKGLGFLVAITVVTIGSALLATDD